MWFLYTSCNEIILSNEIMISEKKYKIKMWFLYTLCNEIIFPNLRLKLIFFE